MTASMGFANGLCFDGYGIFQGCVSWVDEATKEAHYRFKFAYLGGVVGFDVDEVMFRSPPEIGTGCRVFGRVEWRERDSSLSFRVLSFEAAEVNDTNLSAGFRAQGVCKVQHKYIGQNQHKQPVNVADLLWIGGVVKLRDIQNEVYALLPPSGDIMATFKLHTGQVWAGGESHRSQVMVLQHVKPFVIGGGSSAPLEEAPRKRSVV
ncbi:MAG: hypothetical protein ACRC46_13300 [Thermoguttaceae bacterium]